MTIFGPDISSFQKGIDVSTLTDPFVLLKCTEGTYYADSSYGHWVAQAKESGKLVVAYHFVKTESSAQAQAATLAAHIGDMNIPVMLDVETEGSSKPGLAVVLAVADAMRERGLNVRLVYLPRWFWQEIGSPLLTPLSARGIGVVSSAYPMRGAVSVVQGYLEGGGDSGQGWAPYGGVAPTLWQYTDSGIEQQHIDFNAFRGTIDQFAAFLGKTITITGDAMGSYTMTAGWANDYPDVAAALNRHIPVGTVLDETSAAAYATIRSFVAAERLAAVETKLDQLLAVKPLIVDTAAIAEQVVAAITQHLAGGVDVQAVAVAVQTQLAHALGQTTV